MKVVVIDVTSNIAFDPGQVVPQPRFITPWWEKIVWCVYDDFRGIGMGRRETRVPRR